MVKRTLTNCVLRKTYGADIEDGKCFGVGGSYIDDEPCEKCKECKLNVYYPEPIRTCHFCKKEVDDIMSVFVIVDHKTVDVCRECWDKAVKECRKK